MDRPHPQPLFLIKKPLSVIPLKQQLMFFFLFPSFNRAIRQHLGCADETSLKFHELLM